MATILVFGAGLGWLAHVRHRARVQREAVTVIRAAGGAVFYPDEFRAELSYYTAGTRPRGITSAWEGWWEGILGPGHDKRPVFVLLGVLGAGSNARPSDVQAVMTHVGRLPNLRALRIGPDFPVTDAGLSHLRDLSGLEMLILDRTRVSDAGLGHLRPLASLRSLWLNGCPGVTDAGLSRLKGLTSLQYLSVKDTKVTVVGTRSLASSLPRVQVHGP